MFAQLQRCRSISDQLSCNFAHQVCCCSMLCWPSEHIRRTRTKTRAGRRSQTLWYNGSATTWKAWSLCCGVHMPRRKEPLLTGWVYAVVWLQILLTQPLSCSCLYIYALLRSRSAIMSCRLCILLPCLLIEDFLDADISQRPTSCSRKLGSLL